MALLNKINGDVQHGHSCLPLQAGIETAKEAEKTDWYHMDGHSKWYPPSLVKENTVSHMMMEMI